MAHSPTQNMTRCALCTALLCLCGWISIPLPGISVTMQTFGIFLSLLLLGGGRGTAAVLGYLALGCVGLPVFTGFRGGLAALLGPTGGYLWGFLITALIFWLLENRMPKALALILGLAGCYACGTLWYCYSYLGGVGSFLPALAQCVLPFLFPDALKLWVAWNLARRIKHLTG